MYTVTIMGCSRDGLIPLPQRKFLPPEGVEVNLCLKATAFCAKILTRSDVQWRLQKIDLPSLHKDLRFDSFPWALLNALEVPFCLPFFFDLLVIKKLENNQIEIGHTVKLLISQRIIYILYSYNEINISPKHRWRDN